MNKSASLIGRWSAEHDWAGRVAAWASEQDRVRRDTYLDEVEQVARRHARALEDQVLALSSPAAELAMRVQQDPDLLGRFDTRALLELTHRATRALMQTIEVERAIRGLRRSGDSEPCCEHERVRRRVAAMSREEKEAILAGAGLT